ncbi:MAG: MFS transporter [Ferrovibrio sp.]|uniref:MFS transporter n=1 Tax=Ferrovibrio sp. TaxID=1917215 RepID=UPI002620C079|nr:MFS transporter [Ferrovibrio sp.]MCW0232068.1 MFS transporter [Ferrovibrio sp.]
MIATLAPVGALLLSVALLLTGNGLQGTLLPVRANLENFGALSIGVLGSAYYIGFVAGCILTPKLIRRVGHIRLFTAMVAVASAIPLAHAMLVGSLPWWLLRVMTGICMAGLYLIIESWLNERATPENRGLVFTTYTTVNFSVITLGQMLMLADDPLRFHLFSLASILVSLAAVPVALTRSPQPAPISSARLSLRKLYRVSPVGVAGVLTVGLANGAFWGMAPAFAAQAGLSVPQIAWFMSATVVGGALAQWPFGRLSDRMDRRRTILIACALACLAALLVIATALAMPALMIGAAFLFGIFAFPVYALSVAHTNDMAKDVDFVAVAGGLLLINGAGSVIGPAVAGVAMDRFGPLGLFGFTALIHAAMAGFALYRMRQRAAPPQDQKADFVPMPSTAPVRADLDPRADETAGPPDRSAG